MAELRVPDSQSERRDKKALKAYAQGLKYIEEGKSPWLTKAQPPSAPRLSHRGQSPEQEEKPPKKRPTVGRRKNLP